jgi:hypothetical protein
LLAFDDCSYYLERPALVELGKPGLFEPPAMFMPPLKLIFDDIPED